MPQILSEYWCSTAQLRFGLALVNEPVRYGYRREHLSTKHPCTCVASVRGNDDWANLQRLALWAQVVFSTNWISQLNPGATVEHNLKYVPVVGLDGSCITGLVHSSHIVHAL